MSGVLQVLLSYGPTRAGWTGAFNSASTSSHITLSGGDLTATQDGVGYFVNTTGTVGHASGSWYASVSISAIGSGVTVGMSNISTVYADGAEAGDGSQTIGYRSSTGDKRFNGVTTAYGSTFTTGDTIGIGYDATAEELHFYLNGVDQGLAYSPADVTWYLIVSLNTNAVVVLDTSGS